MGKRDDNVKANSELSLFFKPKKWKKKCPNKGKMSESFNPLSSHGQK